MPVTDMSTFLPKEESKNLLTERIILKIDSSQIYKGKPFNSILTAFLFQKYFNGLFLPLRESYS